MASDDFLEKHRFGACDVLDGLSGHRLGQEADEIAGMAGSHRHADLAVGLEAADAGAVPGTRIDDHERPRGLTNLDSCRRHDPNEGIIDRTLQRAAIDQKLACEFEHMGSGLGGVLAIGIAALPQHIQQKYPALGRVHGIFGGRANHGGDRQITLVLTGQS